MSTLPAWARVCPRSMAGEARLQVQVSGPGDGYQQRVGADQAVSIVAGGPLVSGECGIGTPSISTTAGRLRGEEQVVVYHCCRSSPGSSFR